MPAADLADLGARRVGVWGLGREGRAAIGFLRRRHPGLPLTLLDDAPDAEVPSDAEGPVICAFGAERIACALDRLHVIVKSPGVSLYRPEIVAAREKGVVVTSLLNLWFTEARGLRTICVTGTKGKSTTASLIAEIVNKLGRRAALAGNIGVPVSEVDPSRDDYAVIEVSSYQAADFDGICDVAVLTALFPEHLDWHGSIERYYRDKLNLLARSRCALIPAESAEAVGSLLAEQRPLRFGGASAIHARRAAIFDGGEQIGLIGNAYLARPHNLSNLCAALSVAKVLGFDVGAALAAAADFRGLPHRQQELGEIDGVLYVDDSISTTPESAIAALDVYAGRAVTLIVGGYDRGIDYGKLVARLVAGAATGVICLGNSGQRIHGMAERAIAGSGPSRCTLRRAASMAEAVVEARRLTAPGGVVLLSPAAPSYGAYRDFIERGRDFAAKVGLPGS